MIDYFDKVFYINFPKATNRRESIEKMLDLLGLEGERVEGEDDPMYGCVNAQLRILETMKARKYQRIMIFEDDAVIANDNPRERLEEGIDFMRHNEWDLFYFDNQKKMVKKNDIVRRIKTFEEDEIVKIEGKCYTHAMCINASKLDILINRVKKELYRGGRHFDLVAHRKLRDFNIYMYGPGLFQQMIGEQCYNIW